MQIEEAFSQIESEIHLVNEFLEFKIDQLVVLKILGQAFENLSSDYRSTFESSQST
jgi:hypothetical protein